MSHKLFAVIATVVLSIAAQAATTQQETFQFRPKIVGGVEAVKGEFPFQVSLQRNGTSHFCGGSLIKPNWVLTAAHCVSGWAATHRVVTGLHDRSDKTNAETFSVTKVVAHPQYNSNTLDYDYALLQLSGDSKFAPIALNTEEIVIPENSAEQIIVWTSGWGATREGSYGLPRLLQKVDVPLVTQATCNLPASYNGDITERMICAGLQAGGKDSCQGDSGGPLFIDRGAGSHLLVGVVSWGEGCARANKYGVYSKVNNQIDWIAEQTK